MKLNILQKFTLLSLGVTALLAVGLGLFVSVLLTRDMLTREGAVISEAVWSITNVDLPPDVFDRAAREGGSAPFEYIWRHVRQIHNVFRMKVYDADGRIVWSDDPRLIGKSYAANEELQAALRGNVAAQIGEKKSEHKNEDLAAPEDQVMELYVPLLSPGDRSVYGVLEIYRYPVAFLEDRAHGLRMVWGATVGGGLLLPFSLVEVFRSALREQQRLHKTEEQFLQVTSDMKTAATIQKRLLPRELPEAPGYSLAALYQPAREIGGDYYDVFRAKDGSIAIVIGDNEGHGIGGALLMAQTQSMLRAHIETISGAGAVVRGVNETLTLRAPAAGFVTLCLARLDPSSGRLACCSAGQPPALLARGQEVRLLSRGGVPVGIEPDQSYEEEEVQLQPGDAVLFYTDGLTETEDGRDEIFGAERLRDAFAAAAGTQDAPAIIREVLRRVSAFHRSEEWEDDVTLVCLTVKPKSGFSEGSKPVEE